MSANHDVVIIGGGVAGLTAGLFCSRYGLRTLLVERISPGGQIINAEHIENFPGFPEGLQGFDLGPRLQEQAMDAGTEFLMTEVEGIRTEDSYHIVSTTDGPQITKAVIIASGSSLRALGVPGEEQLHGSGVSYCASCDGPFFVGQVVGVIGGGDSALDEIRTLTQYASKILLFHRGDTLSGQKILQDHVLRDPKVEVQWNTTITHVLGQTQVDGVSTQNVLTGETSRTNLDGLFIYIGLEPNTAYLRGTLPLDNAGHIPVDLRMRTSVAGIFAAGDTRQDSAAQLASAVGDGATAAISAWQYVCNRTWP